MIIRILLIVGLITDVVITVFMLTFIDEIGILMFIVVVAFLFGGTIFSYRMLRKGFKGS
ncbi:hypothetical protein JOC85_002894 [Bacillus mesophilus]|uniref:Uncharacterized protein n=1 Tax=Bacillus mesophilus TaxID=1808955 RepID=A0A6M0QBY8_9BACI|nr:hypothetical protein [Bacillus mesophilus]MBM7662087.1 hypothetical protein [Bacillus mesophilus]NEY72558.1 hypothetical protein [Bacillus mesophilus]